MAKAGAIDSFLDGDQPLSAYTGTSGPRPAAGNVDFDAFLNGDAPLSTYRAAGIARAQDEGDSEFWKGFSSYMVKQGPEAVASTVQAGGLVLGSDWLEKDLAPRIRGLADKDEAKYAPRVGSLENIRWNLAKSNPGAFVDDVVDYTMYTLGNGLASTLPSVVAGVAGGVGGGAVGSVVGPEGTAAGALGGSILGATSTSYVQNTGPLFDELVQNGVAPKKAAVWAAGGGVALAGLDAYYPVGAALKLTKGAQSEIRRKLVQRILKEAGTGILQEGGTEAAQEAVQIGTVAAASGKPVDWREAAIRLADNFMGGALAGGAIGGVTGVRPDHAASPSSQTAGNQPAGGAQPPGAPPGGTPPPGAPGPSGEAVAPETGADIAAEAQDIAAVTEAAIKAGAPAPGSEVRLTDPEDGGEIVTGQIESYVGTPEAPSVRVVGPTGQAVELPLSAVTVEPVGGVSHETAAPAEEPVTVRPAAPEPGASIPAAPATEGPAAATMQPENMTEGGLYRIESPMLGDEPLDARYVGRSPNGNLMFHVKTDSGAVRRTSVIGPGALTSVQPSTVEVGEPTKKKKERTQAEDSHKSGLAADAQAGMDTRNANRKRVLDWFAEANDGDAIVGDNGERWEVRIRQTKRGREKSLIQVDAGGQVLKRLHTEINGEVRSGIRTDHSFMEGTQLTSPENSADVDANMIGAALQTGEFRTEKRSVEGTAAAPAEVKTEQDLAPARAQVNTAPTEAQKEAGNYKKGHVQVQGLDITIENPKGSVRSGTEAGGKKWSVTMPVDYGYFKRTEGADGDQVDVFLGPNPASDKVFVIDQVEPESGRLDEHKAMLGFRSRDDAIAAYDQSFSDGSGPSRRSAVTETTTTGFRRWLIHGTTAKRFDQQRGFSLPSKNAPERAPRPGQEPHLQGLGEPDSAVRESSRPVLPQLRGARDSGLPAVEGKLQSLPGGRRPAAEPEAHAGAEGQQRPLRAGERLLGDTQGAGEQHAQDAPTDARGTHAEPDRLGRGTGAGAVDASVSAEPGRDERRASANDAASGGTAPGRLERREKIYDRLRQGAAWHTITALRKEFDTKTGTVEAKELEEDFEVALVKAARRIVAHGKASDQSALEIFRNLVNLYERQPNLGTRTSTSVANQAYSTPAPIAFIASRLAGIESTTTVYEPTAGNGMLLIEANPKRTVANELDPQRAAVLRDQGMKSVVDQDASTWKPAGEFDVTIMNPPFGVVQEDGKSRTWTPAPGYTTTQIDHAIALKALEVMKDDGAAAIIIGSVAKTARSEDARSNAYNGKQKREFFKTLYDRYNVVEHVTVSGALYARQGAAWPVDIIIVKGRGKSARALPAADVPRVYASFKDLEEFFDGTYNWNRLDAAPARRAEPRAAGGRGTAAGAEEPERGPVPGAPDRAPRGPAEGRGGRPAEGDQGVSGREPAGREREDRRPAGDRAGPGLRQPAVSPEAEPGRGAEPAGVAQPAGEPGGEGRAAADRPAAVAGSRDTQEAGGLDDFDRIFDEELSAAFGEEPAPAAPKPDQRSAGEAAASAATETVKGLDDVASGLTALFGKDRLGSGPSFDEETYAKAKPYFIEGVKHFRQAGADVRQMVAALIKTLKETYHFARETIEAMRPYLKRFVEEVQAGAIQIGEAVKARRKPVQTDQETDAQVAYEPRSEAGGLGTLVPVNLKGSIEEALGHLEADVGSIDAYVGKELGYSTEEVGRYFSAEQVDAIALALSNLKKDAGFIIGDQTGVGKGRFVAAMIRWALQHGKTPIFVTEKPNLYGDMYRDLTDIGMSDVRPLMTNAAQKVPLNEEETVVLSTPPAGRHNKALLTMAGEGKLSDEYDVVFTTYSQMQTLKGDKTPRMAFLEAIARNNVVIFDESHNAGGNTQDGGIMEDKADKLDRAAFARDLAGLAASVIYSSATYAKRPSVMSLYFKTDMRLAVGDINELGGMIQRGGIPMQQAVAAMLTRAGQYIRRERSFAGVTYDAPLVPVDKKTYAAFSKAIKLVQDFSETYVRKGAKSMDKELKAEAKSISSDGSTGGAGASSTNFTSIMHNLIDQMLLAIKAPQAVEEALKALDAGEKPVITVANTMGSFIEDYVEQVGLSPGDAIAIDFNTLIDRYLERSRWLIVKKPFSKDPAQRVYLTDEALGPDGVAFFERAKEQIAAMDFSALPVSPIDYMKSRLQQAGYKVGEITGRGHVIGYDAKGRGTYMTRPGKETGILGRRRAISDFNGGKTDVMILNQAGATGLSLHASEKFKDQRKRRMVIAQAEKNIDTHMQMLGRVHRTGQVVTPGYTQMVADVPAEKRPAAVLAKKMASLNANTTGARSGALTAKDTPDFLNQYGDQVTAQVMQDNPEIHQFLGSPLADKEAGLDTEDAARKVTGRIPLLPVEEQEHVYEMLEAEYQALIDQLDAAGENALEAKTLDLDAVTEERIEAVPGKPGGGPFAEPVYAEVADVKRLGKPHTTAEVLEAVEKATGRTPEGESTTAKLRSLEGFHFVGDELDAFKAYRAEFLDGIEDEKKRKGQEERLEDAHDRFTGIVSEFPIGQSVRVKTSDDNVYGVVVRIRHTGKAKNPLALGSWKLTVYVTDARRQMELPFSKIFIDSSDPRATAAASVIIEQADRIGSIPVIDAFDEMQASAREKRGILTGNLLAAFDHVDGKGQIVNFTRRDGSTAQGILMKRGFDYRKWRTKQPVPFSTGEQVVRFIDTATNGKGAVQTPDGGLTIRADGNLAAITTPAAKASGGAYYLNRAIIEAIGQDFVKSGNRMRADVLMRDLPAVVEAILGEGGTLVATEHLPAAREVTGQKEEEVEGLEGDVSYAMAPKITETAAFKRWFGESKVVDENGEPLVVYHGTQEDITAFSRERPSTGSLVGIYLTASPSYAGEYAKAGDWFSDRAAGSGSGPNVIPAYVSIQNPYVINDLSFWERLRARLSGVSSSAARRDRSRTSYGLTKKDVRDLEAQGYDGIINRIGNEVVAFRPEQIKSAIGNRGTFSPDEKRITYALANQQPKVSLRKPGPVIQVLARELRRMVPAANLAFVPELFATSASAAEASGGEHGEPVAGAYGNGLIAMAYETIAGSGVEPQAYARHEAIHGLRGLGFFNEREWSLLEAESRKTWIERFNLPNRPDDARVVEEGIAYAFQAWQPGERTVSGPIARIFNKMRRFFERLVNALKGQGFQTVDDVFERVYSGEVGQRQLAEIAGSQELVTQALKVADEDLREIAAAYAKPGETVSTGPDGRTNRFENDLRFWRGGVERLRRGQGVELRLGDEFFVLAAMGERKRGISMAPQVAKKIADGRPDIPARVWRDLPELISDPLFVYGHRQGGLNVVIDATMPNGQPLVVGVRDGAVRTITPQNLGEDGEMGQFERQMLAELRNGRKVYAREGAVPTTVLAALRHSSGLPPTPQSGVGRRPSVGTKKNIISREDVRNSQGRIFYSMADVGQKARQTVENLKGNLPLAPNVGVEAPEIERDLNPLKRPFFIPASLFKDWPALAAAVDRWSRRQAALQSSLTRVQREWNEATRRLSTEEMETLTAILFRGDALGEAYTAEDLANLEDEDGNPIAISERTAGAYQESRTILDKLGNLVDQHERAMRNYLRRKIKPTLIRRIARSSPLSHDEASTLLTKRYALRSRLHTGNGDPAVLAARIEKIEAQLGYERGAEDPLSQAIDQLDIVDRTLNRTSIKRRDAEGNVIEGYVPHKFFGSWAVYSLVEDTDADGEPFLRRELIADYAEHGFHASRADAIEAANRYAEENPDEQLVVRPVAMRFAGSSAATLPGPQYQALIARVSEALEVPGDELRETLKDTIRPRSKRRWAGFKQKRLGIEGYSRDLDRVIRAHIGEVMRYVYLDKVKYEAITLEESLRLEEGSRRRPQLGAAWRAYVRDVLSERQPLEKVLDSLFDKPWLQPLQVGLGGGLTTFALAGGISGNPFVGLLLGSWVGYRFYQSRKAAGEMGGFYSRGLTGELLNTTAHLKLGAVFNLFSAVVNVTQIALNTASVLPYKYVAYGVGEALKTTTGASKRWVQILDRHNIDPVFRHSEVSPHIYDKPSRLAQLSMIAFDTVEKVNRSATFIGAYKQAMDGNARGVAANNPGAAQRYAMRVVNRTQFDYSNAMKPEALRNVFLRVPLQFKNFIAQQIAFVAGLQSKAEVGKFLLHMFLLTGVLGLPGLQFIDWLVELLTGKSPIVEVKRIALQMQAEGAFVGTMVDALARGFPALFGVDISSRAGMGERFLPSLQVSDLIGPMPSTIQKARQLAENEAGIVDQLRNLSTGLGGPLKALESAANGMPITTLATDPGAFLAALSDNKAVVTNPRKKLRPEVTGDSLSTADLAMMAVGGSPIGMTKIYDFAAVARFDDQRLDQLSNRYMNRIAEAYRTWMPRDPGRFREEVNALRIQARDEDGLLIGTQAVRRLMLDMQRDRTTRTIFQYRKQQRPDLIRLAQGLRA